MKVAIICDGQSDYEVIKAIIEAVCKPEEIEFLEWSRVNLHDKTVEYLKNVQKANTSTREELYQKYKKNVQQFLSAEYNSQKRDFEEDDTWTCADLIIVNTDSELLLTDKDFYFNETRSYNLPTLFNEGIELFYRQQVIKGHSLTSTPLVVSFVPYPSIEIVVAAAMENYQEKYRTYKANPDLKNLVWDTDNIPEAVNNGWFKTAIQEYLVAENFNQIYQHIPEIRTLLHTICFLTQKPLPTR